MLYVYRASAGSGKTHLLTGFYIKLLFQQNLSSPNLNRTAFFDEILAVTFTNKATAEMKSRIIEELKILSTDPTQSHYYEEINPKGKNKEEEICQKAKDILTNILNDYSNFNISTIDSFFQKIVRSFARELNIQGSYEINLDSKPIIEAAVNAFIENVGQNEDKTELEWLLSFSNDRISQGSSWDLKKELYNIAQVLTQEDYKIYGDEIAKFTSDKKALKDYIRQLKQIIKSGKQTLNELGEEGITLLKRYGLAPEDFAYGFPKILLEWQNGEMKEPGKRFISLTQEPNKWFAKKNQLQGPLPLETIDDIQNHFLQCISFFEEDYIRFQSALTISKNIYQLGILASIDKEIRQYCADECIMMLSNTTELLNRLIGTEDAPFIYEKIGTRINHFMIDEFQDTSGMQWNNFKPLLSNALSMGHKNLIVGDVKQSIYRWRGSDWGLLHSKINNYERNLRHDDNSTLRTNWRSSAEIINFNNKFFPHLSLSLENLFNAEQKEDNHDITEIYADVEQQIPSAKKKEGEGWVKIDFVEFEERPKENDKITKIAEKIPEKVIQLQQNGYEAKDIAIIARTKVICAAAVEALMRYKKEHPESPYNFNTISSEALFLTSRPVIQAIISLLQFLQNPNSEINKAVAACNYYQLSGLTADEALQRYFNGKEMPLNPHEIRHLPIYELIEEVISILPNQDHSDIVFVQSFKDLVLEFSSQQTPDLSAFLEWWKNTGSKKTIETPAEQNAIQIMTIHASKGLGMPAVIIPFSDWEMDIDTKKKNIIWCKPQDKILGKENLILPISLNSQIHKTIFNNDFQAERLRIIIDNINTVYVGFTRAKSALILIGPKPKEGKGKSSKLSNYLSNFTQKENKTEWGMCLKPGSDPSARSSIQFSNNNDESKEDYNPLDNPQGNTTNVEHEKAYRHKTLPRLSQKLSQQSEHDAAIIRGNLIHIAMAAIIDNKSIETPIDHLYNIGLLDETIIERNEMKKLIKERVSHPSTAHWFLPGQRVLNEHNIISLNKEMKRPDRIIIDNQGNVSVIDYKTGQPHKGYRAQVKHYMHLLSQMGFSKIRGYIWYIDSNKISDSKDW